MKRRRRAVAVGALSFVLLALVALPFQLAALANLQAQERTALVLEPPSIDIAATPIVGFGPGGRSAVTTFGATSWVPGLAASLCATATGFRIRPREVEVGFLETAAGPRAVLADYCTLPAGGDALTVALVRGAGHEVRRLLGVGADVASAQIVATRSRVELRQVREARHGVLRRAPNRALAAF